MKHQHESKFVFQHFSKTTDNANDLPKICFFIYCMKH